MIAITIAVPIALAVAYALFKHEKEARQTLSEPHDEILMVGVQIICGDCCGDAERPEKTYLNRNGECDRCGGRSYMLASSRLAYIHPLMTSGLVQQESDSQSGSSPSTKLYLVRAGAMSA